MTNIKYIIHYLFVFPKILALIPNKRINILQENIRLLFTWCIYIKPTISPKSSSILSFFFFYFSQVSFILKTILFKVLLNTIYNQLSQ